MAWKTVRGKLPRLKPLEGIWEAREKSPRGPLVCTRRFTWLEGGKFLQLDCGWEFGGGQAPYGEHCLFGIDDETEGRPLTFWSFTSDGKRSTGWLVRAEDLPKAALVFEAEMKAGLARQAYWGGEDDDTMIWVVESKTKKGWKRFVEHRYRRVG